ncbi:MAG: hypothetical protein B7733_22985 [Myxococcales bacterium FL481]|nr:MAG: hypothetical protein B7733_22985 [Myxococcales bacterium FL481]
MTHLELDRRLELCVEPDPKRYEAENTTAADREAIRNSIFELEPNIFYWCETVYQSAYSIDVLFERVEELVGDGRPFCYLIDLTRAKKPDARTRTALKKMFSPSELRFSAIFTNANVLLNIAARFVLRSAAQESKFEVFRSYDQAFLRVRDELQRAAA